MTLFLLSTISPSQISKISKLTTQRHRSQISKLTAQRYRSHISKLSAQRHRIQTQNGAWKEELLAAAFVGSHDNVAEYRFMSAVEHLVGNDKGWDPHSNLHGWASRKIFRVGDNLWFAYASGEQSVLEVKSREEWEACDISNPIRLYNGGVDSVPLVHEGSKFFSSGRVEDCRNDMKLHINVDAPGSSSESKSKPSWPLMATRMKNFAAQAPTSGSPAKSHFSIFCYVLIIFFAFWLH